MAQTLADRVEAQLVALRGEKARIRADADRDLAAVNAKIDVLVGVKLVLTGAVEEAFTALRAAGYLKEV